jgi:hypothetical protein
MKRRFSASSGGLSATKCNGLSDSELISTVQMLREVLDAGVQVILRVHACLPAISQFS